MEVEVGATRRVSFYSYSYSYSYVREKKRREATKRRLRDVERDSKFKDWRAFLPLALANGNCDELFFFFQFYPQIVDHFMLPPCASSAHADQHPTGILSVSVSVSSHLI